LKVEGLLILRHCYSVQSSSLSTIYDRLLFQNLQSLFCPLPSASKTHNHIVPLTKPTMLVVSIWGISIFEWVTVRLPLPYLSGYEFIRCYLPFRWKWRQDLHLFQLTALTCNMDMLFLCGYCHYFCFLDTNIQTYSLETECTLSDNNWRVWEDCAISTM